MQDPEIEDPTESVPAGTANVDATLPDAARQRAISVAAELLSSLPTPDVPLALRRVAKFAPARRARLGAAAIAAALASDVGFRQRAGELAATRWPAAVDAVRSRGPVDGLDPVELAAVAYLLRPPGWAALVARAGAAMTHRDAQQVADDRHDQVARLREQLEALRASSREQLAAARSEIDALRAANSKLRQRLGAARETARVAEQAALRAADATEDAGAATARALSIADAEGRRLRGRLAEVEASLESTRRAAREGRTTESIRTRLLLDTLLDVAHGLRRELALPPVVTRPADLVASVEPDAAGVDDIAPRGRTVDDPTLLEHLLELPHVHLVVDGYNVTKSGYGELPLEAQRSRLNGGLGALAARTAAEVTVVFDGARLDGAVRVATPRGVRVLFSPPGVTADHVIRELVRAEPVGRPVVVVSSDREVAVGVHSTGARPVASTALLRLLDGR